MRIYSAGTLVDEDGELFVKPCVQAEVDFYESAASSHPEFASLMPVFMGTLSLTKPEEAAAAVANAEESSAAPAKLPKEKVVDNVTWVPSQGNRINTKQAIVLENSSAGFTKPNVLDAKLGERLWADDAPLQKKQRFDKISAETTHKNLGFRIAGMKVYRGSADQAELDDEGYRVYGKDYGRSVVNDDNIVDVFRSFVFNEAAGIDAELGRAVCASVARDVARVEEVLSKEESRMYSASLLFIVEGDGQALREAIRQNNAVVESVQALRAAKRVDSGIALEDEDVDEDEDVVPSVPSMYSVKLIDFAHAQWTPGQGPDENVLKGVRHLRRIFEELAK